MKLFYYPSNASMAPHFVLEEIGQPFELALVDRTQDKHKSPEYLKLNPNGLIPVLIDGDLVLYETAAICLHLADKFPQTQLAPAFGTPERSQFYMWLMWLTNTFQATLIAYFYPERWVDAGNADGAKQVQAHAEAKIALLLDQLENQLQTSGGPWFLGAHYSVLDPYALMLCRWTRQFSQPARLRPRLASYLQQVLERPAVQRALRTEGLEHPWI
ncbi:MULTISPECIES: glutathione S-transferase family protein [unclassified Paraburkholderia]|uniref:glutathione S-transferase family protein n=1 Tax=unclassified Paraburkholderia TaxID=2615204 RepID=UPI002AAFF445|nr:MULTISPECIES: glutathione S-transferase family protein [unclassified Paraburkholderia]